MIKKINHECKDIIIHQMWNSRRVFKEHQVAPLPMLLVQCQILCIVHWFVSLWYCYSLMYTPRDKDWGLWIDCNCEAQVPDFQWNTISFKHDAMKQTLQLSHSIGTWPTSKFTIMLHFANAIHEANAANTSISLCITIAMTIFCQPSYFLTEHKQFANMKHVLKSIMHKTHIKAALIK